MNAYLHFLFFDGAGIFAARMALSGTAHMEVLNMRDPLEMAISRRLSLVSGAPRQTHNGTLARGSASCSSRLS